MRSQLGMFARTGMIMAIGLTLFAACAEPEPMDETDSSSGTSSTSKGKKKKNTASNDGDDGQSGSTGSSGSNSDGNATGEPRDQADAGTKEVEKQPAPGEDLGEGDGKDVVAIGDSYMRLPTQLQEPGTEGVDLSLNKASGRTFRSYAFTGASLLPLTIPPKMVAVAMLNGIIPGQLDAALKEGPVKTLLISGGGNDLPQGGGPCKGPTTAADINAECKDLIDKINKGIDDFVATLAGKGVKDVVWVMYGATDPSKGLEGAIAALRDDRKKKCVPNNPELGVRCHYIDDVAANIPTRDGFHPTTAGYDTIGQNVWARMQKEGVRR